MAQPEALRVLRELQSRPDNKVGLLACGLARSRPLGQPRRVPPPAAAARAPPPAQPAQAGCCTSARACRTQGCKERDVLCQE